MKTCWRCCGQKELIITTTGTYKQICPICDGKGLLKEKWLNKEKGPDCFCGNPTVVTVDPEGAAGLLCLFHTYAEGALFPLPKDKPEKWPDLNDDEMKVLIEQGAKEQGYDED